MQVKISAGVAREELQSTCFTQQLSEYTAHINCVLIIETINSL